MWVNILVIVYKVGNNHSAMTSVLWGRRTLVPFFSSWEKWWRNDRMMKQNPSHLPAGTWSPTEPLCPKRPSLRSSESSPLRANWPTDWDMLQHTRFLTSPFPFFFLRTVLVCKQTSRLHPHSFTLTSLSNESSYTSSFLHHSQNLNEWMKLHWFADLWRFISTCFWEANGWKGDKAGGERFSYSSFKMWFYRMTLSGIKQETETEQTSEHSKKS